jgi:hypothetical protein
MGVTLGLGLAAAVVLRTEQQLAMQRRRRTWMVPELGGRVAQGGWH